MILENMGSFIKNIIVILYSIIIFFRIENYKRINWKKCILLVISVIVLSILYLFSYNYFGTIISKIMVCLLQAILLRLIIKTKIPNILIGSIISHTISYILLIVSGTIEFLIQKAFNINILIICLVLTAIIEGALVYLIFGTKRLRDGVSFLKTENEFMEIAIFNITTILMLTEALLSNQRDIIYKHLYFYYIILAIFLILMIYKTITMYYKQKLVNDTIAQYERELKQKDDEIKSLTEETFKVSKINHEFYNRQKSLELMVKNALENTNMEAGEELDLMDRIKEITEEHSNKMKSVKSLQYLPLTDICELDDMFKYMQTECSKSNIQFKLNINGNIHTLINNFIPKNKLVTLVGDHIRDAIIAVNVAEHSNKEILVVLGIKNECYELCILDTGIEFQIDTLLKLGSAPITTHKDTGGSGIGFVTTFETLKECSGSLIIEEKGKLGKEYYTKAVKIRFDGRSEYRICSYRLDKIFKDKRKYEFSGEELIYRKIGK